MTRLLHKRHRALHPRSPTSRYLAALGLVAVALVGFAVLHERDVDMYAPLVGAVALSCWYGGSGPGLFAIVVGWSVAWYAFTTPRVSWEVPDGREALRWAVPLLVSFVIVAFSVVLRRAGVEAEDRAENAEREQSRTEAVRQLASELSAALTPSDVAHTLVTRMSALLGSTGAALGLIEGDELRIVDPTGVLRQTMAPGSHLPLAKRTPITTAARTGEVTFTSTRESLDADFPDGAVLAPDAAGALALPLRTGGSVVGAMSFLFDRENVVDEELLELARLVADIGGQALERAFLYEQERQSREGLDRILSVAPRFESDVPEIVVELICREALTTFGSDVAQIWELGDDGAFHIACANPPSELALPGSRIETADYPGLAESLANLNALFIPDSPASVTGAALEHARHVGIRSSLRVPIAVRGRVERLLVLQWQRPHPEPPAFAMLLARRFADHAGLALEQTERRRAQSAVIRNAHETRRLLDLTASLAAVLEQADVAETALHEAISGLDASAGVIVRRENDSQLAVIGTEGHPESASAGRQTFPLAAALPLTDAVRRNEIVALESAAERARRYPGLARDEGAHGAWLAVPLVAAGEVVGGLELSFASPRSFLDGDREFALSFARQAGQALERSRLLEAEQTARRRAEAMASDLAQLHALATTLGRAATAQEVAQVIGTQLLQSVGADGVAVYAATPGSGELSCLDVHGLFASGKAVVDETLAADDLGPVATAAVQRRAQWLVDDAGWGRYPSVQSLRRHGVRALGAVPLLVGQETVGSLLIAFDGQTVPSDDDRRFVETVARQAAQPLARTRLLDQERAMRRRADLLGELTASLSGALVPDEVIDVFVRQVSHAVGANAAAIGTVGDEARVPPVTDWRGDTELLPAAWLDATQQRSTPLRDVIQSRRPRYFDDAGELLRAYPDATDLVAAGDQRAFAFVPALVGRRPNAVTVLAWGGSASPGPEERSLIETIASQCAQALDRAQKYEVERTIAETLQRSVLPETLPAMEGATVAARYLPGTSALDVGGDWFDTLLLADGRLGFVVGDVVGKGVKAAATMAQLRNGMRALTLDSSHVGRAVTKLNQLLDGYTDEPFATLAFLAIDPVTRETELISAGHLPPLVLAPGQHPRFLEGGRSLPLGVDPTTSYEAATTTLEAGSIILLYTDGLVERRDRPLDDGLRLLAEAAADAPLDPDELVRVVVDRLIGDNVRTDDVAVLAVALADVPLGAFAVRLPADPESLPELRRAFGRWLVRGGIPEVDRHDLVLATWEASANAVEHARDPSEPVIGIEATLTGDRVVVEVTDTGHWREPRELADRGLGLRLIESLMTSFAVEHEDHGTRIVMERALSRRRAEGGEGEYTS